MSLAENRLPDALKQDLVALGLWSMRYSTLAILNDLPIGPLIEVNRNMLSGLRASPRAPADRNAAAFEAPIAV